MDTHFTSQSAVEEPHRQSGNAFISSDFPIVRFHESLKARPKYCFTNDIVTLTQAAIDKQHSIAECIRFTALVEVSNHFGIVPRYELVHSASASTDVALASFLKALNGPKMSAMPCPSPRLPAPPTKARIEFLALLSGAEHPMFAKPLLKALASRFAADFPTISRFGTGGWEPSTLGEVLGQLVPAPTNERRVRFADDA